MSQVNVTDKRLANGTKVHTNVALTELHNLRSLSANIDARTPKATGIIRGSYTWDRGEPTEEVVYAVEHDPAHPSGHYHRNEFNLISMANDFTAGCIMSTYASAKAELEALEEILAKHFAIDSHVRERLIGLDRDGHINEDDPLIGHAIQAWQEALATFVNWPTDDDGNTPAPTNDNDASDSGRTSTDEPSLPPIVNQYDHIKYLDGHYSVYPGHPLTIAYIIAMAFPTLADALVVKGDYPAALGDIRIPGAGGEVWGGVSFLTHIRDGVLTPEQAVQRADDHWRSTTSNGHRDAFEAGQAQADKVKAAHLAEIVAFAKGVVDATKEKP